MFCAMTSLWLGLVVIMLMQLLIFVVLQHVWEELKDLKRKLAHIDATRQTRVKQNAVTRRNPGVDAKARTTRRDTDDIPTRGGRMSRAVHREKTK